MKNKIVELIKAYRQMLLYAIIGASGATLDAVTFALMITYTPINYLVANAISVSLGITNNFLLNVFFNFKTTDKLFKRFVSFYSIGLFGLAVTTALLYVLVDLFDVHVAASKVIIIFVAFLLQYNLNKKYSFKQHAPEESTGDTTHS